MRTHLVVPRAQFVRREDARVCAVVEYRTACGRELDGQDVTEFVDNIECKTCLLFVKKRIRKLEQQTETQANDNVIPIR